MNAEEEQSQAAAQFENACSDRIKQFDDSDSDEEVGVESGGCGVWDVRVERVENRGWWVRVR